MKVIFSYTIFIFILAGCATAPVQNAEQLSKTHGYVFADFPKSGSSGTLIVEAIGTKKTYTFAQRKGSTSGGVWVPAGEYKISSFWGYEWGEYDHIVVEAGRITDLGSLIPIELGGYDFVILPVRSKGAEFAIQAPIAEFKDYLSTSSPILWSPKLVPRAMKHETSMSGFGLIFDLMVSYQRSVNKPSINKQLAVTKDIDKFFEIAKGGMPPNTDQTAADNEGNLYFGAALGQIRTRSKDGVWASLDTGSLSAVTAVWIGENNFFAGFEDGTIKVSKNKGITWNVLTHLNRGQEILDIDFIKGKLVVVTCTSERRQFVKFLMGVSVYISQNETLSDLKSVFTKEDRGWYGEVRGESNGGYYFFNFSGDLFKLNLEGYAVDRVAVPKQISSFHLASDNKTIAAWLPSGAFSNAFLSSNLGDTWREIDTPPMVINDIVFQNEDVGVALRLNPGMFTSTPEYYAYDKVKNKWTKTADGLAGCVKMLHDEKNLTKFCVSPGGNIFGFDDVSRKWKAEFIVD